MLVKIHNKIELLFMILDMLKLLCALGSRDWIGIGCQIWWTIKLGPEKHGFI